MCYAGALAAVLALHRCIDRFIHVLLLAPLVAAGDCPPGLGRRTVQTRCQPRRDWNSWRPRLTRFGLRLDAPTAAMVSS